MSIRRLTKREDTTAENRDYSALTTSTEVIKPDAYTPLIALTITVKNQGKIRIFASASACMKSTIGYGVLRVTWTQGGLTHVIDESQGVVDPLSGQEYHREIPVTGLTVGDAVGVSLEAEPLGETLVVDKASLYVEEW